MAALLTSMSICPKRSTVCSNIAAKSSSLVTSQRIPTASPPSCVMRSTAVAMLPGIRKSPSFSVRADTTTFAPSRANTTAISLPIPRLRARDDRYFSIELAH